MDTISLRIKALISFKEMNISSFEKRIGAGNNSVGTIINRNSNVSGLILSKILITFEDVSADWLLLGKGEILRDEQKSEFLQSNCNERIKELEERLAFYKEKNEFLDRKLRDCEENK
jgi:hypothetical protein